jgi:hypothetical protein
LAFFPSVHQVFEQKDTFMRVSFKMSHIENTYLLAAYGKIPPSRHFSGFTALKPGQMYQTGYFAVGAQKDL